MKKSHIVASLFVLLSASFALHPPYDQSVRVPVDTYNVPNEIDACMKRLPGLIINGEMNPFYLSADFDGDGRLDFAIQVTRTEMKGIAVCLSSQKAPIVLGAGSSLIWPPSEKWRFNAWSVVPKESTAVSRPAKAKHDAILLDIKETANGLLYWDGRTFRWKQLSD
ncbi:MAG TPA: hypothetical protein VFR08_07225 [Candidatus Angelobacter sp.]|nr:hypothetical protein [Candidatus Angelobacter sp.]